MSNRIKSLVFDFFQIASIVYLLFSGPVVASRVILMFLQIIAGLILLLAARQMRRTKYYRVPDVGKPNELVQTGIYRYVRNPMYLSQLLFLGVSVINFFTLYRFIVYLIFLINFLFKITYEEELLRRHFKEFTQYKKISWRLVPFVY